MNIREEYFNWLYSKVCDGIIDPSVSYKSLLNYLFNVNFYYSIPLDSNREGDGIRLRYRFGDELGYSDYRLIASCVDDRDCSVLEVMVALALRCEEQIMSNPIYGDRTGLWFWHMIESLGLDDMNDDEYDPLKVERVIFRFLDRNYKSNGEGGLFTINGCDKDLRTVEIWCQLMRYLDTIND